MKKIGVFGGSFDPPHEGHQTIIFESIKELNLDWLIVIPNGQPPHKFCETKIEQRLKMCELAFSCMEKAEVSNIEAANENINYTYNTLTKLKNQYPDSELHFIIGGDSAKDFFTWKNYKEILKLAKLCVFERKGVDCKEALVKIQEIASDRLIKLNANIPHISSSRVRLHLNGFRHSDQIPQQVENYICEENLYNEYFAIISKLKTMLTACRFRHTINTAVMAAEIAKPLKIDMDKVIIAALLHDCAKCQTPEEMIAIAGKNVKDMPVPIRHGYVGAILARKQFGISDRSTLNAIRYHSTGRPKMSLLEKIIYVADAIEEGRGEKVEPPRELAVENFPQAFKRCLIYRNSFVQSRHSDISSLTHQAVKYYINEKEDKT